MTYSRHFRQLDLFNPDEAPKKRLTLIGAGGIGSHVGLVLAKMGLCFEVYDPDRIENHNLSNQLYGPKYLGSRKVDALYELIQDQTDLRIVAHEEAYQAQSLGDLVISGVDSIDARRAIWRQIVKQEPELYLDARTGAEITTIFCLNPRNRAHAERYAHSIRPEVAEGEPLPCSAQAISYNLWFTAAAVGKLVQLHLTGRKVPNEFVSDLPNLHALWVRWPEPGPTPKPGAKKPGR